MHLASKKGARDGASTNYVDVDCPLLDAFQHARYRRARLNASSSVPPDPGFSPRRLLTLLAGRTLLLLGDSVTEQHFHALACQLFGDASQQPKRTATWYAATNAKSELFKTRSCLPFAHDVLLCYVTAGKSNELQMPRPWILSGRLRAALQPSDIVLVNVGVHFDAASAAATHYQQLVGPLIDKTKSTPPLVIYRESAPQHFSGGRYPPTDRNGGCVPLVTDRLDGPSESVSNRYNRLINPIAEKSGTPILRIWSASAPYYKEHLGPPKDCTHWILPGVPDYWSGQLYRMLSASEHASSSTTGLMRALPKKPLSVAKRWTALRKAFVGLSGCVYHPKGQGARQSSERGQSKRWMEVSALTAAETAACCDSACRERYFLPHGPSGAGRNRSNVVV